MPAVVRSIARGASLTTAQSLGTVADGDTVVLVFFRNTAALPSAVSPTFDTNAHYTNATLIGARVSVMTWNTGDPTSFSSSNGNLGYAFIVFEGSATIGTVQSTTGTTASMSVPAVTLADSDGSSRVFTVNVHRDASAIDAPDGMTELDDFSPATSTTVSIAATGGVTSWAGDATVPVTDSAGTAAWRSVAFEVTGPDASAPPGAGTASGTYTFTGSAGGKRTPKATAAGSYTYSGSAVGKRAAKATSTGAWAYSGTAVGTAPTVGAAEGTATGTWAFTGSAVGVAPAVGISEGTATGAWSFTGTAVGVAPSLEPVVERDITATALPDPITATALPDPITVIALPPPITVRSS